MKLIIATLADTYDENTPFRFLKLDIKDGFWSLAVSETYAWNFCYVIPQFNKSQNIKYIKVVFPNFLQMVWY